MTEGVVIYTWLVWGFNCCVCVITRCWAIRVQEWSIACGVYWYRYWSWRNLDFVLSLEMAVPNVEYWSARNRHISGLVSKSISE